MKRWYLASIASMLIMLSITGCSTGITEEEYELLGRELSEAEATISGLQAQLDEAVEQREQAQSELDAIKASPPILEVDLVDIGEIARVVNLKLYQEPPGEGTYKVEAQLELLGELPDSVNVVDVELFAETSFADSDRWIDISSTGFVTTKESIILDTGLAYFADSIQMRVIPAFKVFGAR